MGNKAIVVGWINKNKPADCGETINPIIDGTHILTLGIQYQPVQGGIAAVIASYSRIIRPFHFIATASLSHNRLIKILSLLKAICQFLYFMLFRYEIKIIHIHSGSKVSFWRKSIFILIGKAFGKKIICHMHGGAFKDFTEKNSKKVHYVIRHTDCLIALSESWRQYFEQEFNLKNIVVVNNIIDYPHFEPQPHDIPTLLFLGCINKNKGIYDLLDVIIQNKTEYNHKMKLLIGGKGEVESIRKNIKDNNISDIVSYIGWVSGEKKIEVFNQSDIFILPSYYEGLPVSILEAMSYSMPIISTNIGGIPEIVKDGVNGYLIHPGNKEKLKQTIDILITNTGLQREMGKESQRMVRRFLPESVIRQLSDLYKSLLINSL